MAGLKIYSFYEKFKEFYFFIKKKSNEKDGTYKCSKFENKLFNETQFYKHFKYCISEKN